MFSLSLCPRAFDLWWHTGCLQQRHAWFIGGTAQCKDIEKKLVKAAGPALTDARAVSSMKLPAWNFTNRSNQQRRWMLPSSTKEGRLSNKYFYLHLCFLDHSGPFLKVCCKETVHNADIRKGDSLQHQVKKKELVICSAGSCMVLLSPMPLCQF